MNRPSGRYRPRLERFRRSGERSHLLYYLPIFDAERQTRIGVLADLSAQGLLLVGHERYAIGQRLRLHIAGESGSELAGSVALSILAEVRWSAPDVNPAYVATGVRFVELDSELEQEIQTLIQRLGRMER
ncbi:hypothetical protein CKO15_08250 [Halorhodospira abdelmalekii]|uniref:PilZ domain-containing protein n=1 Tax=Halorhodospira abdelmalekii TaxID=421629 RepID=UPI001902E8C8|nr:PilZ domain-containing protein [Halorhodospira abdelmalekii]MBK1735277.1 hypothetical protein [Halorhodospira abdelmalekii]